MNPPIKEEVNPYHFNKEFMKLISKKEANNVKENEKRFLTRIDIVPDSSCCGLRHIHWISNDSVSIELIANIIYKHADNERKSGGPFNYLCSLNLTSHFERALELKKIGFKLLNTPFRNNLHGETGLILMLLETPLKETTKTKKEYKDALSKLQQDSK